MQELKIMVRPTGLRVKSPFTWFHYTDIIIESSTRNAIVINDIMCNLKADLKRSVVVVSKVSHGESLLKSLTSLGVKAAFINGSTYQKHRVLLNNPGIIEVVIVTQNLLGATRFDREASYDAVYYVTPSNHEHAILHSIYNVRKGGELYYYVDDCELASNRMKNFISIVGSLRKRYFASSSPMIDCYPTSFNHSDKCDFNAFINEQHDATRSLLGLMHDFVDAYKKAVVTVQDALKAGDVDQTALNFNLEVELSRQVIGEMQDQGSRLASFMVSKFKHLSKVSSNASVDLSGKKKFVLTVVLEDHNA